MSTGWTHLDTELSETTTMPAAATASVDAYLLDEHLIGDHPTTVVPPAVERSRAKDPDVDLDVDVRLDRGVDERLVDEDVPAEDDFGLDLPQDRLGVALVFAAVALAGVALGVFATPTPVVVAGWVVAVLGGLMAFRELAGGDAR